MLNVKTVEDKRDVRKRSFRFSLRIIKLIEVLPKNGTCKVIGNQLLRSGTSIGANVAEAKGSSTRKDFTNFFSYALKSAHETVYWLDLLDESGTAKQINLGSLRAEAKEILNMLGSSLITLKGAKLKGKF